MPGRMIVTVAEAAPQPPAHHPSLSSVRSQGGSGRQLEFGEVKPIAAMSPWFTRAATLAAPAPGLMLVD